MTTLLLTGASGFLGRRVLARLQADNDSAFERVVCTGRSVPEDLALPVRAAWRRLDLTRPDAVDELVREEQPSAILHLSSMVTGKRDRELVLPMFQANLASTVHLLHSAAAQGCRRFVQAGSLEEPSPGDATAPVSPYAAAKAAASTYCRMYSELYGLEVAIARIFMVYGPGAQDLNKLVPYVITNRLAGRALELSSGQRPVDWVYVDDVAEGLLALAAGEHVGPDPIDLGSGELVSVRDVVEQLCETIDEMTGKALPPPTFGGLEDRDNEAVRTARVDDTRQRLGWRASTSLAVGLRRCVDWFRAG